MPSPTPSWIGLFYTLVAFASFASPASGTCTNFTNPGLFSVDINGQDSWTNVGGITLDHLICASDHPCRFEPKTYNITVPRELNVSLADPAEEVALFGLAERFFWEEARIRPNQTYRFTFATRSRAYTTSRATDGRNLEVGPGYNRSLVWWPLKMTAVGRLAGCTNESLEGTYVRASAVYLEKPEKGTNGTDPSIMAGFLGGFSTALDNDTTTENGDGDGDGGDSGAPGRSVSASTQAVGLVAGVAGLACLL